MSGRELSAAEREARKAGRDAIHSGRPMMSARAYEKGWDDGRLAALQGRDAEVERLWEVLKRIAGMGGSLAFAGDMARAALNEKGDPSEQQDEPSEEAAWAWKGLPGHFVCADKCCFRLHTIVGTHRISTVGCYHPASDESGVPHEIGAGRLYETMVFAVDDEGPSHELDFAGYNDEAEAERGHIAMCRKYA